MNQSPVIVTWVDNLNIRYTRTCYDWNNAVELITSISDNSGLKLRTIETDDLLSFYFHYASVRFAK